MSLLQVEITDFVSAAETLHDRVGEPVASALAHLSSELAGCAGMAGDDPGGRAWARSYDQAARSTLRATHQVVAAAFTTASMFGRSAINYADAETASTTSGSQRPSTSAELQRLPATTFVGPPRTPPAADGGSSDTPPGWWLVQHTVGYVWPSGHQDQLHRAAAAWNHSAAALDDAAFETFRAGTIFNADHLPEADDILTVTRGLSDHLTDLATTHRALADACTDLAGHIDACHSAVEHELVELLAWTAGIQTVGAIASLFTLGTAEAPTQAAQAAKTAQTAGIIGGLIAKCLTATRTIATTIAPIALASDRLSAVLEMLATSKLAASAATSVPAILRTTKTGTRTVSLIKRARTEVTALEKISSRSVSLTKRGPLPSRIRNRIPGEPGQWGDKLSLEDHFARHGPDFGARSAEDYVARSSDFLQRGYREGLPMRVTRKGDIRVWDPSTRTFGSYRPDGSTRTFYIAPNPRYFDHQPGKLI